MAVPDNWSPDQKWWRDGVRWRPRAVGYSWAMPPCPTTTRAGTARPGRERLHLHTPAWPASAFRQENQNKTRSWGCLVSWGWVVTARPQPGKLWKLCTATMCDLQGEWPSLANTESKTYGFLLPAGTSRPEEGMGLSWNRKRRHQEQSFNPQALCYFAKIQYHVRLPYPKVCFVITSTNMK